VKSLRDLQWTPGKEFEIVTVSINPLEGADLATQKKKAYLESYGRPEAAAGWHFLTGSEANIKKLASQVGFLYKYDNEAQQYAHTAAIFALTPEGKISRYLYGIDFQVRDLKLSMLEASNGQIGSTIDRFLLFCYRYDPKTKKYSVYITDFLRAGSAVTVFLFGGYLFAFWRRQGRRKLENVEMSDERGES
jgi:protein SCO1/2